MSIKVLIACFALLLVVIGAQAKVISHHNETIHRHSPAKNHTAPSPKSHNVTAVAGLPKPPSHHTPAKHNATHHHNTTKPHARVLRVLRQDVLLKRHNHTEPPKHHNHSTTPEASLPVLHHPKKKHNGTAPVHPEPKHNETHSGKVHHRQLRRSTLSI